MSFELSTKDLKKLNSCYGDLETLAIEAIKGSPYPFGITWGHRSPEIQGDLYAKGRTAPGKIVTYCDGVTKLSKHNYSPSLAFDIVIYVNGKVSWESGLYLEVGTHIMEVAEKLFEAGKITNRITWGGHWHKFKDWPHFQI